MNQTRPTVDGDNEPTGNVEIFKEGDSLSQEELSIITRCCRIIKFYDDKANGIIAFALDLDSYTIADTLVNKLNANASAMNKAEWYLGDPTEEYVFVE